nr:MAG TPA: hypothetical protein [Caudoviricetes sp.]
MSLTADDRHPLIEHSGVTRSHLPLIEHSGVTRYH